MRMDAFGALNERFAQFLVSADVRPTLLRAASGRISYNWFVKRRGGRGAGANR